LTHTVHAKDLAKDVTSQRNNNTWTDWAFRRNVVVICAKTRDVDEESEAEVGAEARDVA